MSGNLPSRPGTTASSGSFRERRNALCAAVLEGSLEPGEFPRRYAALADDWLSSLLDEATEAKPRGFALLAVGGFGRGELCPESDLDVVLLHKGLRNYQKVAKKIWYAIWDEGIHLDHSVRTRSEAVAVARSDMKAVLGLLDGRLVAGDERLSARLLSDVAELWRRQAPSSLRELDDSMSARHKSAGELAFLLEPDLKQSAGGLRDVAALRALCAALPELPPLAKGAEVLAAERLILAARVVLHCRTGSSNDRLLLQEQDEVAERLGFADADRFMAAIAEAGRSIATACTEGWRRARFLLAPEAQRSGELPLGEGIVLRAGEVALASGSSVARDATLVVRLALAAAERNAVVERESLEQLAANVPAPSDPWPDELREAFVALLGTGDSLVPAVEALDRHHLVERLLPEWTTVRNRPQRNAYHRFTVDRHLLEAVARASDHLDGLERPDLLLLGALFHDIGKGTPGDHSEVGTSLAATIATRMGLPPADVAVLERLVAYHLVLPEFATRRDLDDPSTAQLVAKLVKDTTTLELLGALTEADSRATGQSAWGPWKAELVSRLVERVRAVLEGRPLPSSTKPEPTPAQVELLARGELALEVDGSRVTVVAPDRPGLLAAVTGAFALNRCNVRRATAGEGTPGMAMDVFDVEPAFDRMPDFEKVERDLREILDGVASLDERLAAQDRTYARGRRPVSAAPPRSHVRIDGSSSAIATIVEVRAPDRLGLLHDITAAFSEIGLDVASALVDTLGHEVIDTFYVRESDGSKLGPSRADEVRATLHAVIVTES